MKTRFIYIAVVLGFSFLFNGAMTISGQNDFKNQQEAIKKAQQDLVSILESDMKIDLDLNAGQVREAKPLSAVANLLVDFEALLQTDSVMSFNQLTTEKVNYVVPLSDNKQVVAVVRIAEMDDMWKVSGLGDQMVRNNLNQLPDTAFSEGFVNLRIFEVPNILAVVYVLDLRAGELAFTDYQGFSIREGIEPAILIEMLKNDARKFQEAWGDKLKENKYVK